MATNPLNSTIQSLHMILLVLTFLVPITQSSKDISLSFIQSGSNALNIFDYSRLSISKAQDFLPLVNKHLESSKNLSFTSTQALQDCKLLTESSIDYLTTCKEIIIQMRKGEAEQVQTLLSAVLTNIETCIDGLRDTNLSWNSIMTTLSNDLNFFSGLLSLFTKRWIVPKPKNVPHIQNFAMSEQLRQGKLNLKMSKRNEAIYRYATGSGELVEDPDNKGSQVLINDIVVVDQNGKGNFTTINDAVDAAPCKNNGSNGYFLIYVKAGVYEEYVYIHKKKKYLMMIGNGINQTVVTGNHNYVDGWTTFGSATFIVTGEGFVAINMTFRNTAGPAKHQAVAVRNDANVSTFYRCSFEGYQDTLYVHSLKQFYKECDIYGTVDFICGNAEVLFQNCNLYPRLPLSKQFNAITAQSRKYADQNTGILIYNCTIRPADDLARGNITAIHTYLGRPWKEYSRTVYMYSSMDSFVNPEGWRIWSKDFALNTLYYAEFNNSGPGSNTTSRVTWPGFHILNATEAAMFSVDAFLNGDRWMPHMGLS